MGSWELNPIFLTLSQCPKHESIFHPITDSICDRILACGFPPRQGFLAFEFRSATVTTMFLQRDTQNHSNEPQPQSETGREGEMVHRFSELLWGYVVRIKGDCRWQKEPLKEILRAAFSCAMFYIIAPLKQISDNELTLIITTWQHIEASVGKVLCIPK